MLEKAQEMALPQWMMLKTALLQQIMLKTARETALLMDSDGEDSEDGEPRQTMRETVLPDKQHWRWHRRWGFPSDNAGDGASPTDDTGEAAGDSTPWADKTVDGTSLKGDARDGDAPTDNAGDSTPLMDDAGDGAGNSMPPTDYAGEGDALKGDIGNSIPLADDA